MYRPLATFQDLCKKGFARLEWPCYLHHDVHYYLSHALHDNYVQYGKVYTHYVSIMLRDTSKHL